MSADGKRRVTFSGRAGTVGEMLPKTINIRFDLRERLSVVAADATQLHQVLMNLCLNARDGVLKVAIKP